MNIVLTAAARRQLLASSPNDGLVPRIDAEMTGGCGISVRLSLVWDEPRRMDVTVPVDDHITLHLDQFTKRYAGEQLLVDYNETDGFVLGEAFDSGCTM